MKNIDCYLVEKIDEESLWSLQESILSSTGSGDIDEILKKWLKKHSAKRIKVEDGKLLLSEKHGVAGKNELTFLPGETTLPDNIEFKNDSLISSFIITGPDLKSIKWIPKPAINCKLFIVNCDSLEDFDLEAEHGAIYITNCKKLKSFSGVKNIKKIAVYYITDCPSVKSIKEFEGKYGTLDIDNCGVTSLEGYTRNFRDSIEVKNCNDLYSLDIKSSETPRFIEIRNCQKISKVGNCSWPKKVGINYIYLTDCPNIDENFLEELYNSAEHDPDSGTLSVARTKIDPNSPIVQRIKKENPGWRFVVE